MKVGKIVGDKIQFGRVKKKITQRDLVKIDNLNDDDTYGEYNINNFRIPDDILEDVKEGIVEIKGSGREVFYLVSSKKIIQEKLSIPYNDLAEYNKLANRIWPNDKYHFYIPDIMFYFSDSNRLYLLYSEDVYLPLVNLFASRYSNYSSVAAAKKLNLCSSICIGNSLSGGLLSSSIKDNVANIGKICNVLLSAQSNTDLTPVFNINISNFSSVHLDLLYRILSLISEKLTQEEVLELYKKMGKEDQYMRRSLLIEAVMSLAEEDIDKEELESSIKKWL